MGKQGKLHGSGGGRLCIRVDFVPSPHLTVVTIIRKRVGEVEADQKEMARFWIPVTRADLAGLTLDRVLDALFEAALTAGMSPELGNRLRVPSRDAQPVAPAPPVGGPQGGCTGHEPLPGV